MAYFLFWAWGFGIGLIVGLLSMWAYAYREAATGFMITCPGCKVKFNSNDGIGEDV